MDSNHLESPEAFARMVNDVVIETRPRAENDLVRFWKQKVPQRAVRPKQTPCDQSVHSWHRQAAKICSSGFEFESADYFALSRRSNERLTSALRLALRTFLH
jgi:hypothetical protein